MDFVFFLRNISQESSITFQNFKTSWNEKKQIYSPPSKKKKKEKANNLIMDNPSTQLF